MSAQKGFDWQIQSVVKEGRKCQQFAICKDDADCTIGGRSRAEVDYDTNKELGRNDEGMFSVLVPGDRKVAQNSVIFQWHGHEEDREKEFYQGSALGFQAWPDSHPSFPFQHIRIYREREDGGFDDYRKQYVSDVWTDFHYSCYWIDNNNGFIRIWQEMDDTNPPRKNRPKKIMLYEYEGKTANYHSPIMKYGIYHPNWSEGYYTDKVYIQV